MQGLAAAAAMGLAACAPAPPPPLQMEAYVWQRVWTPEVADALSQLPADISSVCILWSEMTWRDGRPEVTRARVDLAALGRHATRTGFAIRIPETRPPLDARRAPDVLAEIELLLAEARRHGLSPHEIQIDYDCPTRHLRGYADFLAALRETAPVKIVPTALPDWLGDPEWPRLAKAAGGGFVLQLHGLSRPRDGETVRDLHDASTATLAIKSAARAGVPFRIALPTYSSTVYYDSAGKILAVLSEGGAAPPEGHARAVEFQSNPAVLAALVADLRRNRPTRLGGILWYRLPIASDRKNWPPATWQAVREGRVPEPRVTWHLETMPNGALSIILENSGDAAGDAPPTFSIPLPSGDLIAFDALRPYDARVQDRTITLEASTGPTLAPGTIRPVGWLRMGAQP